MPLNVSKPSLLILTITAFLASRSMFLLNDPEGPNLLIVGAGAGVLFFFSLSAYFFKLGRTEMQRLIVAVFIQAFFALVFYFLMR